MYDVGAQGCRAVGPVMRVTQSEGPTVFELDHKPALEQLQRIHRTLNRKDKQLHFKASPLQTLTPKTRKP